MDRRQRKTRNAILGAFTELVSKKDFEKITVGEIIERADVGRATFYSHFETKEFLLKEFCQELFCHVFDTEAGTSCGHPHIFECNGAKTAFLHILRHLQSNDNKLLTLLSSQNNGLFLKYFRDGLERTVEENIFLFEQRKSDDIPPHLWKRHITAVFLETVGWWTENGMKETPEEIAEYFYKLV